jgi:hypothetical protein
MADLKLHMTKHLHSARQWLMRAEESFDKDSTIRGELDLFLAQAELQHARETNSSRQWRHRNLLMRHAFSLLLATIVAAAGVGAYLGTGERNAALPAPPDVQLAENTSAAKTPPEAVSITPLPVAAAQPVTSSTSSTAYGATVAKVTPTVQPVAVITPAQPENAVQPQTTEQKNLVPPDDMQKIVQTAARSLRGQ